MILNWWYENDDIKMKLVSVKLNLKKAPSSLTLHHYIIKSLNHYITTSLNHYIVTSLHHYITSAIISQQEAWNKISELLFHTNSMLSLENIIWIIQRFGPRSGKQNGSTQKGPHKLLWNVFLINCNNWVFSYVLSKNIF